MSVYPWACMYTMCVSGFHRDHRRGLNPLEMELWFLGTEQSERYVPLNHCTISPIPHLFF